MIYQYSSIKEVIGNVIRNTGVTDTRYIADLPEWIGEAMSFMRTNMELVMRYKDVTVDFHIGQLPAGCVSIEAVEYNRCYLPYKNILTNRRQLHSSVVPTQPQSGYVGNDELIFLTEAPQQCNQLPHSDQSYYTEMGCIRTSFSDSTIRIHYKSIPVDDDCFPLVPDNANYKQALYWHCRAMMIGAGYEDRVFKYDFCDAQYEKYAARAIAGIRYPSVDMMNNRIPTIEKYLPENYLSYFGMGSGTGNSPVTGFVAQMPVSKTDAYLETVFVQVNNP